MHWWCLRHRCCPPAGASTPMPTLTATPTATPSPFAVVLVTVCCAVLKVAATRHAVTVQGDRDRVGQAEVLAVEVGEGHAEPVRHEGEQVVARPGHRRRAGREQRLVGRQERGLDVDHVLAVHRRAVLRGCSRADRRPGRLPPGTGWSWSTSKFPLPSSVISSFSGTSAVMAGVFFADRSSSSAWEVAGWLLLPRSGAVNGVQPSVGSRNASTRMLSLPFASVVAPAMLPAFDVVFCAVCPVAGLSR